MKKIITNEEIVSFWNILDTFQIGEHHVKFIHGVVKTINKLKGKIKAIHAASIPVPGYNEKVLELEKELAEKDDKGEPVKYGPSYLVPKDEKTQKIFNEKLEAIKKETGQDCREKDFNDLLKEEDEIEVHVVDIEYFPNPMTKSVMTALLPLVKESEEK
jgi:hypothetical protein